MKLKLAFAALLVLVAACGSAVAGIAPTTTDLSTTSTMAPMDTTGGMNMGDMNMGDASAVAASEVVDAQLVSGEFRMLDSAPSEFDAVAGNAAMARHDGGTTVTIEFENLPPTREYVAHVHAGSCFDNGGPHYQFDVGGSDMPPNEIHLAFTSDTDGSGFMTAENHQVADENATAVVIHERTADAPKIACADLG